MTAGKPAKVYPWEAAISLAGAQSKALADQIRTVSKQRLINLAGATDAREMSALDDALRFH